MNETKNIKNKSIKKNAVLNGIRVLLTIIFPLITFPYASRVLGTDNLGVIQFSSSIIVFVTLFASLGISSYATREGAAFREDRKKLSEFASKMFTINIIFTMLSYLLLFIILMFPTKLMEHKTIILILSIQVFFTTIGVDWIYSIYEDYFYITIRTLIGQIVSLILMFAFVKNENDYYIYAFITVIANSGINILNFIHSKKYCDLRLTKKIYMKKHLPPLLDLFSNNLAQQVYINSDSIMLGIMSSDYSVGIYSVAVKIYSIVKKLLNAIITVTIPRLAYYSAKSDKQFNELCIKIFKTSILFILPVMLLLFLLSENIISFISGNEYIEGTIALKILSLGLLFAVFANLFCNGILIVKKEEKYVLRATIYAAIINFGFNILLIPLFKQNGAAITTAIAEFIVMIYTYNKAKKYIKIENIVKEISIELVGCIGIICIYIFLTKINISNNFLFISLCGGISLIIYAFIQLILKNQTFIFFYEDIKLKILKKVARQK